MANEELIYRITRAIYDRLGAAADESTVEQLVTDIYRTVEPAIGKNGSARSSSPQARATFSDSNCSDTASGFRPPRAQLLAKGEVVGADAGRDLDDEIVSLGARERDQ